MSNKKNVKRMKKAGKTLPQAKAVNSNAAELMKRFDNLNQLVTQLKEYTPDIKEKVTMVRDALRGSTLATEENPLGLRKTLTDGERDALADHLDVVLNKLVTF